MVGEPGEVIGGRGDLAGLIDHGEPHIRRTGFLELISISLGLLMTAISRSYHTLPPHFAIAGD
jgi:hypothetical protein